ncbi:MAG TPA: addiction module protein [Burkholderiaceae bacterium]|nr:addiction module protein [Burkholderiaceae bacterium]HMX09373.1 addiction module protein [Burkholderiaceae bacterium]HMY98923.1 addiction module protein [Burkholderiaceae bacterium]HNB47480.1 addiction module protein [Burkholderiaceae bacterium]HNG79934.1 addiction module protein [Burkholderiaceae bacterium]
MQHDPAYADLFALPLAERLQLVEDLWDSIATERAAAPVHPQVANELRERLARYDADPSSGISWEDARRRLRDAS